MGDVLLVRFLGRVVRSFFLIRTRIAAAVIRTAGRVETTNGWTTRRFSSVAKAEAAG
jgi:hypothetical protein